MAQRTFLNMTHNPFAPPRQGFFPGADRKTHLDHLRQLSRWSRRILVVSGAFGIGKSTLFRELSNNIEPNTKAARVSGTVVTSEREVLMGLLQGFGVEAPPDGDVEEAALQVCEHAADQDAQQRVCMAMVDDAHLLDAAAVHRLVNIVSESELRLVLFAEASVIGNVTRAAKQAEVEWFEIRLTGFPRPAVRDYLEWRFAQAQYRGLLPFTDEQIDKIVARSAGNPSVIDFIANEMLADLETGQLRRRKARFPARHAVLAGMLLVLMVLAYLFAQPGAEEEPNVETVALPERPSPPAGTEQRDGSPTPRAPVSPAVVREPPARPDDMPVVEEPTPAPEAEVSTKPRAVEPRIEPMEAPARGPVPSPSGAGAPAARPEPEPQPAPRPAPQPAPQPAPRPTPVADAPPVQRAPEPAPRPPEPTYAERAAAAAAAVGYNTANWLLRQDPERYTLQLVTLSKYESATELIARQPDPGEFAVFRNRRNGQEFFVITYGVFSSRAAAERAALSLHGELKNLKPWIRPFSLVQEAVRATPQ